MSVNFFIIYGMDIEISYFYIRDIEIENLIQNSELFSIIIEGDRYSKN